MSVAAFLGGVAFTGLIITIQFPSVFQTKGLVFTSPQEHFTFLITMLAITSLLLIAASFAMLLVGSGVEPTNGPVSKIATWCFITGGVFLVETFPALLLPFTLPGALFSFVLGGALFVYLILVVIWRTYHRVEPSVNPPTEA